MNIKYLLRTLAFAGLLSQPALAQSLSADDVGFAFDPEVVESELNAVDPKPSSVVFMTEEEMLETEGEAFGYDFSWDFMAAEYYHLLFR